MNELYSILVSANDVETDEEWDFEMLLLHAYIRNREKFDSAVLNSERITRTLHICICWTSSWAAMWILNP